MPSLALSENDVRELRNIANSHSLPHALVQQAQIILACGTGETNTTIAKRMGVTGKTVEKWRKRYRGFVIEGLHDELRWSGFSGQPPSLTSEAGHSP
jgi:putative transposase